MTEFYYWNCEPGPINAADALLLLSYKLFIHAVALFLIFSIRKIKLSALNDYKANSVIVFVETAMFLIVIVNGVMLRAGYPSLFGLVNGTIIFIGSTSFLGLTFIPKVSKCAELLLDAMIQLYTEVKSF